MVWRLSWHYGASPRRQRSLLSPVGARVGCSTCCPLLQNWGPSAPCASPCDGRNCSLLSASWCSRRKQHLSAAHRRSVPGRDVSPTPEEAGSPLKGLLWI